MQTDCAVCYGSITDLDPATTGEPCNCSGTIKYHPFCYEDMCSKLAKCPVCKAAINKSQIFDESWVIDKSDYYNTLYYTIDSERKKHGKHVLIKNKTRKIVENGHYIHGLKDGLYQKFDLQSNIIHEGFYKMGLLNGPYCGEKLILNKSYKYSMYYEDGLLNGPAMISRNIKNWEKTYEITTITEEKKLFGKQIGNFKNGMMHGAFKIYDHEGTILESIEYKDDEKNGKAIFYNSGTIEQTMEFKKGSVCGKLTVYWPHTGTEQFTCIMCNDGMVRGPVYINDESGGLLKKIMCKKPTYLANVLPEGINIRKPSDDSYEFSYVKKEYYLLREFNDDDLYNHISLSYDDDYDDYCNHNNYESVSDEDNYWDDDRYERYERRYERYERRYERY
jgi:antitoxin component YwqK of YwqJK toxin-antitoxin module